MAEKTSKAYMELDEAAKSLSVASRAVTHDSGPAVMAMEKTEEAMQLIKPLTDMSPTERLDTEGPIHVDMTESVQSATRREGRSTSSQSTAELLPAALTAPQAHMTCLVLRTQLWTEFLDYEPDLACGRRTTSTLVGKAWSKVLVVFFLVAEAVVTFFFFDDILLMTSTCVGVVAFVCLEVVAGTTDQEKKKAMKVQTGVGFSLVFWIWYKGLFAARPL